MHSWKHIYLSGPNSWNAWVYMPVVLRQWLFGLAIRRQKQIANTSKLLGVCVNFPPVLAQFSSNTHVYVTFTPLFLQALVYMWLLPPCFFKHSSTCVYVTFTPCPSPVFFKHSCICDFYPPVSSSTQALVYMWLLPPCPSPVFFKHSYICDLCGSTYMSISGITIATGIRPVVGYSTWNFRLLTWLYVKLLTVVYAYYEDCVPVPLYP